MSALRFYSFCNFYLSSIQQGIQSGHALGELVVKYRSTEGPHSVWSRRLRLAVIDFLENHKTWVVLNGGAHQDIEEFFTFLDNNKFSIPVPFASFYEDEASLGGIMTCVGLILPEEFYDAKLCTEMNVYENCYIYTIKAEEAFKRNVPIEQLIASPGTLDWELINRVKSCGLAR
jgi:hypothetical protein